MGVSSSFAVKLLQLVWFNVIVWLSGIPCDGCIPLQPYAENREHFYSLSSPPNGHSLFGKSFISPILPSPISHLPSFLSSLNFNQ
ncbi:hypothetical protein E1A91_A08G122500v1 [Gossypium mustelinum]|uniref:Secreted protein n=1 Tax=Gossypium mustelinum TaxID=34275 RepID=A0A5D2Y8E3_GOSMU|nr:hypothetical protein E1A91_A08G122500v1 [Gossypium mustelinum]